MKRLAHYTEKTLTTTTVPDSKDIAFINDTREILTHGEVYGGYIGTDNSINLGGGKITPVKLDISANGSTMVNHDTFGTASKINLASGTCINLSTSTSTPPTITFNHADVLTNETTFTRSAGQVVSSVAVTKQGHISSISFNDITTGDLPTADLTMKSDGTGETAGSTYNGKAAKTISYNSIGAAPLASPAFTGTPTTPTPTVTVSGSSTTNTQIANVLYVILNINGNSLLRFIGPLSQASYTNDIATSDDVNIGMMWEISEAGTYAGQTCKVGDVLLAIADKPKTNNSGYLVLQRNVDLSSRTMSGTTITALTAGLVTVGTNINLVNGDISVNTANGDTLGLVKQGTDTTITSGAVNVTSAPKLDVDGGSTSVPVYFTGGVPTSIRILEVAHGGTGLDTIENDKILVGNGTGAIKTVNNSITIGPATVSVGGSITLADLGLTPAMRMIGITSTAVTNGGTENPTIDGTLITSKLTGDVVIYGSLEYMWANSTWHLLGLDSSFKILQTAYNTSNSTANKFILDLSQNTNGDVTCTLASLDTSGTWSGNATTATTASKLGSSNLGSTTQPIYLEGGTAKAGTELKSGAYHDSVGIFTALTSAEYNSNLDQLITRSFMSYWTGAYVGSNSNLTYCKNGTIIGSNNIGSQSVNYATSAGNADTVDNYHVSKWGGIPVIGSDGVMEVGKYIDFHASNDESADYCFRLTAASGSLTGSGSWYANSDIRYKDILENLELSTELLAKLPIFKYIWNDRGDKTIHVGSSALAVEKLIPELVTENEEGFKSLDYATLGTVIGVKCALEVLTLKEKNLELEAKVSDLENRLLKLELIVDKLTN